MPDQNMDRMARDIFSGVRRFTYDNDFTLYVLERPESASVSVQAWVKTGSINEEEYLGCGLSHFLEHMLFQGCEGYSGQKCADTVNALGGYINAYTSYADTVYHIDVPGSGAETAIDILCSMLKSPEFPGEKFTSEKNVILRERDMGRDNHTRVLFENLWRSVFKVHPVRHPIIGYRDKIVSVTRDMMMDYYRRRYSPVRSFMVICGKIDAETAAAVVGERISAWPLGNICETVLPVETEVSGLCETDTLFKDPLSRIAFGLRSAGAAHPQLPALDVLYGILGASQSSRLVRKLQLEKELALNINSFHYSPYFGGLSGIFAVCVPEKLGRLEQAVRRELREVAAGDISGTEIEREVLQQTTDYLRMLRTNSGLAGVLGNTVVNYGGHHAAGIYYDRLCGTGLEQVKEAAAAWLDEARMSIVRQHPADGAGKSVAAAAPGGRKAVIESTGLRNGGRLVMLPRPGLPLLDICVVLPGGVIMETAENSGITSLLCSLLTAGTARWNENELGDYIDGNALDVGVTCGNNSMVIRINCRSDRFDAAMEVLQSMMTEPLFEARTLRREKTVMLEGLKSRRLNPQNVASDKMLELMFGAHPYSRPSVGNEESIASITPAKIRKYYRSCLIRDKMVFAVGGAFDKNKVRRRFEELAGALEWSGKSFQEVLPEPPVFSARGRHGSLELPREQSVVMLAMPGFDNAAPERYAFDLIMSALNGLSSRLFKTIREEAGLAYMTGASFFSGIQPGAFWVYAVTSRAGVEQVEKLLRRELKRLRREGLDGEEFEAAKRSVIFDNEQLIDKQNLLVFHCALSEFYGIPAARVPEMPEIYRAMTREEIAGVLRKYLGRRGKVAVTVLSGRE